MSRDNTQDNINEDEGDHGGGIGLQRQLTMGGFEELNKEATEASAVERQDDVKEDACSFSDLPTPSAGSSVSIATSSSGGRKRMAEEIDLQPELLLKRQETSYGTEPQDKPTLMRAHSLIDQGELDGKKLEGKGGGVKEGESDDESFRRPLYDTSQPTFDNVAEEHKTQDIFSHPPGTAANTHNLFVQIPRMNTLPLMSQTPLSPGLPLSPEPMPLRTDSTASRGGPTLITRQESWKEDVSDAGWRAW